MGTVREALLKFAAAEGVDAEEFLRVYLNSHYEPSVSERYRRLVTEVLWRLPEGWDEARDWFVESSPDSSPRGYASARHEEEADGESVSNSD